MVRIISILAGAFFSAALLWAFGLGAYSFVTEPPAPTAEKIYHLHPKELHLASDGAFGAFSWQGEGGFQNARFEGAGEGRLSAASAILVADLFGVHLRANANPDPVLKAEGHHPDHQRDLARHDRHEDAEADDEADEAERHSNLSPVVEHERC